MLMPTVILYLCAAAVVAPGAQLLAAMAAPPGEAGDRSPRALLRAWRRPVPVVAATLVALMVALAVVQTVFPDVVGLLERHPGGEWWRALTALLVQSSGWFQLAFNLAALIAVAPIAERRLGGWQTALVYVVSGVSAQAVSLAAWSPEGAGNSVAICGLVGALAAHYALRGPERALRLLALLIPVAGVVLCLLTNNHGVGVVVGTLLGAGLTLVWRPASASSLPSSA
ncbi:membrane protein, Rhomboid family [[Actinomadura] parvosata subsp. kistnae]|nr:membrane protein, Rhomboid family [Actinomadura parvosata subsp. kistnae]